VTRSATESGAVARPSVLRIGLSRSKIEIKQFFRNKGQMVFTFSLPLILLLLLGIIFSGEIGGTGVQLRQLYATGMLGVGIMSSSFQSLTFQIVTERNNGGLKRLRGTPMPKTSYFIGKIALVLVSSIGQAVVLLGVGSLFFGLVLPRDLSHWLTFVWVFFLGVIGCSLVGIAFSSLVRNANSSAVVIVPFMVLQFISGVFVPFFSLPGWIQQVASVFPLKWLCQGMRSVFLPDSFAVMEPAGGWEHGLTFAVLAAWAIAGLVLSATVFRWKSISEG
jgi:ABC-2 type transport system permease protein